MQEDTPKLLRLDLIPATAKGGPAIAAERVEHFIRYL